MGISCGDGIDGSLITANSLFLQEEEVAMINVLIYQYANVPMKLGLN
ncbi:hypothetical protein SDC9_181555 [bioreactor metagenome]|uniref:Uncharacterized protein n=1 Tax=bioreactor metagenome TaxID=1076179 RepID=A0A645HE61_9ZZZZ